jgi:hypothetical protein
MESLRNLAQPNITPQTITPDHVRGLSLKEITAEYGTLGLHTRLYDSLGREGLLEDPSVDWSVNFALTLHAEDTRTNGQYVDHLMRVTLRILDHYGIIDPAIIKAAMLHDSVEDHSPDIVRILRGDTSIDPKDEAVRLLGLYIGEEAASIVNDVSNPEFSEDPEVALEEYRQHTIWLVQNKPKGRVLKLSDFNDNAVGNHYSIGSKRYKLDKKYLPLYSVHAEGLFMPDSIITGSVRDEALRKLQAGRYRSLARLGLQAA